VISRQFLSFVCVLGLSSCSGLPAVAQDKSDSYDTPVADKWALIVGVSKFKNERLNLQWAAKDAEDFYKYLITKGQFAADHVKLLTNERATEKEIVSELGGKWLPHVAAPDDLVVIFISSHGSPAYMDTAGVNYILAHDSDPEDLYSTALEMQDLVEVISKRIHASRVIVIVDACHSGALEVGGKGLSRSNFDVNHLALGKGRVILSSSLPEEVSWELKGQPNSIFTRLLIDTLSDSKANRNLFDDFKTLKDSVQRTALKERGVLQTPVLKSTWLGAPPILAVTPSKLPPVLQVVPVTTTIASATIPQAATLPVEVVAPETLKQLPSSIAIVPFNGPLATKIQALPPGSKVLWGKVSSPAELSGLAPRLSESLFYNLRSQFHDRALGPRLTNMSLSGLTGVSATDKVDTRNWTPAEWVKLGQSLQARYLISGTVDEADWSTSFLANKYTAFVSAKVVSGDTGQVLASVNRVKVHKAPTHGDLLGGRKYFENTVMPDSARAIVKQLMSTLKDDKAR